MVPLAGFKVHLLGNWRLSPPNVVELCSRPIQNSSLFSNLVSGMPNAYAKAGGKIKMFLSAHFTQRQEQRGLRRDVLNFVLEFGELRFSRKATWLVVERRPLPAHL